MRGYARALQEILTSTEPGIFPACHGPAGMRWATKPTVAGKRQVQVAPYVSGTLLAVDPVAAH